MTDEIEIGPVDYLIVEFPGNKMTGEGIPILVDLHESGTIRILDLAFVTKDAEGAVVGLADFDADGVLDLDLISRFSTGLLDEQDVAEAASILEPNSSAAILVFENAWAAPLVGALHRGGAQLVASARIPAADLLAAVEAANARD